MTRFRTGSLAVAVLFALATTAIGDDLASRTGGRNVSEMSFMAIPNVPTCVSGSVQKGNPFKTEFILLLKASAGCVVPWHWHGANEHLMIVSGEATIAMRDQNDGKPVKLSAAGFALLPRKHTHQFRCLNDCTLYLYSDRKFDIHYVDPENKEITPAAALEPFAEKPGSMPKST